MRTDSLSIAICPQAWQGEPTDLNSNYFCVYVQIRNYSKTARMIDMDAFAILVDGEQYDPIALQTVLLGYQVKPFLEEFNQPFMADRVNVNPEGQRQTNAVLVQESYSFGSLVAGGTKRGYLFFDRRLGREALITIRALGRDIVFGK